MYELLYTQPIPDEVTFSKALSKLKAQSSNVSVHWNVEKETFELCASSFGTAFENVTPSGIGCINFFLFPRTWSLSALCVSVMFWFTLFWEYTRLEVFLFVGDIQMTRSSRSQYIEDGLEWFSCFLEYLCVVILCSKNWRLCKSEYCDRMLTRCYIILVKHNTGWLRSVGSIKL